MSRGDGEGRVGYIDARRELIKESVVKVRFGRGGLGLVAFEWGGKRLCETKDRRNGVAQWGRLGAKPKWGYK